MRVKRFAASSVSRPSLKSVKCKKSPVPGQSTRVRLRAAAFLLREREDLRVVATMVPASPLVVVSTVELKMRRTSWWICERWALSVMGSVVALEEGLVPSRLQLPVL